jgi:hypothetical protein
MMKSPIARIGRENHLDHIINVLPLITVVYGIQCYIMSRISPGSDIGDFALYLAFALISFISGLFYYDKNHHVIFYEDYMHISFNLFGTNKKIFYKDIKDVIAPDEECKFSSLMIKTREQGNHVLHFVDYPLTVKTLILENKAKNIINIYKEVAEMTKVETPVENDDDTDLAA